MIKPFFMNKVIDFTWIDKYLSNNILMGFYISKENIPCNSIIEINLIDYNCDENTSNLIYTHSSEIDIPSCFKLFYSHSAIITEKINRVVIIVKGNVSTDFLNNNNLNIYVDDLNIDIRPADKLVIDSINNNVVYGNPDRGGISLGNNNKLYNIQYIQTTKMDVVNLNVSTLKVDNIYSEYINNFIKLIDKSMFINIPNDNLINENNSDILTNTISLNELLFNNSINVDLENDISLNDYIEDTLDSDKLFNFVFDNIKFLIDDNMNIYLKYNNMVDRDIDVETINHPILKLLYKKKSINAVNVIYLLLYVCSLTLKKDESNFNLELPVVNTLDPSTLTHESVTLCGEIKNVSDIKIIDHGFVIGNAPFPNIDNSLINPPISLGYVNTPTIFEYIIPSSFILPHPIYWVRTYIKVKHPSTGIESVIYGSHRIFKFPSETYLELITHHPINITDTSITLYGEVFKSSSHSVSNHGFIIKANDPPTLSNYDKIIDLNALVNVKGKVFYSNITGLTPNTTYYARSYWTITKPDESFISSCGTHAICKTLQYIPPEIQLNYPTNITINLITVGGSIEGMERASISEHGVVASTTPNPTTSSTLKWLEGVPMTPNFSFNLTGLNSNTRYYIRAYIVYMRPGGSTYEVSYSNQFDCTTL